MVVGPEAAISYEVGLSKEKPRLALRIFVGIRGVYRVPLFGLRVELPHGPRFGFCWISRANGFPERGNCIASLEHDRHAPAGGHEFCERCEEWALAVNLVERSRLFGSQPHHSGRHDLE